MALSKHLVDIIRGTFQDDQRKSLTDWFKLHAPERYDDVNGNGDDVFNASNIQQTFLKAPDENHGYPAIGPGTDKKVYDAVNPSINATRNIMKMWQDHLASKGL